MRRWSSRLAGMFQSTALSSVFPALIGKRFGTGGLCVWRTDTSCNLPQSCRVCELHFRPKDFHETTFGKAYGGLLDDYIYYIRGTFCTHTHKCKLYLDLLVNKEVPLDPAEANLRRHENPGSVKGSKQDGENKVNKKPFSDFLNRGKLLCPSRMAIQLIQDICLI